MKNQISLAVTIQIKNISTRLKRDLKEVIILKKCRMQLPKREGKKTKKTTLRKSTKLTRGNNFEPEKILHGIKHPSLQSQF